MLETTWKNKKKCSVSTFKLKLLERLKTTHQSFKTRKQILNKDLVNSSWKEMKIHLQNLFHPILQLHGRLVIYFSAMHSTMHVLFGNWSFKVFKHNTQNWKYFYFCAIIRQTKNSYQFCHLLIAKIFITKIRLLIRKLPYARNGRNTPTLIFENLKPVEIIKKSFQHHLNILKVV